MSIFLTGDTHGALEIQKRFDLYSEKLREEKFSYTLRDRDFMIVLGDFGLLWGNQKNKEEEYWTNYVSHKPWTTLFIDGNHENFERLNTLPEMERFGSKVGVVAPGVYHLKRGNIYTIEGKTFFCMGGANSIDKAQRRNRVSWWEEELPNKAEYDNAIENLRRANFKIDYVLTHCAPRDLHCQIINSLIVGGYDSTVNYDQLNSFLEYIQADTETTSAIEFKKWFFGHYHIEREFWQGKYQCLYESIIKLV